MRKLATVLSLSVVLYAMPAFGERIKPKPRSVDRSTANLKSADTLQKAPMSQQGGTATTPGTAYSNVVQNATMFGSGYCYSTGYGPCIFDDYDSVIDKPFIQGTFTFLGGMTARSVMWITFFDSVGSFLTSGGWYFDPGLYIYGMNFLGAPAADVGIVGWYPDIRYGVANAIVFADSDGTDIGTSDPTWGNGSEGDGNLMMELTSVEVGICCIPLTGDCQGPMDGGSCPGVFDPSVVSCDPNPCPPGTCGNGVVDPPDEQCDDGNTIPGDGCNALCQEEVTYIPAVSEWGLLVMALLGLTVGTVLFGRRRAAA